MTAAAAPRLPAPLRALLDACIDYAGLFPPAALPMREAVANYARYLAGPDAWALGRFVVPVARLGELAAAFGEVQTAPPAAPWRLSAVAGADVAADMATVRAFNHTMAPALVVDAVEARGATPAAIHTLRDVAGEVTLFVELPLDDALAASVAAVRAIGAQAKIRTGGVTPDAFPAPRDIARFLRACADAGVAFKATAGLHHPRRGEYALTYEPGSVRGTMYGYVDVFVAAALALAGADEDVLAGVLVNAGDGAAVPLVVADGLQWPGGVLTTGEIEAARASFARSFGSCSFREPLDELPPLIAP